MYVFVFFLSLTQINNCGIYSFSGTSISDGAETVCVHYIKNTASLIEPNLSNKLTENLKTKCLNETSLAWKNSDADINFSGTIKSYQLEPISIQNNETAAQNRLTISVEINYINTINNSNNFNQIFIHYSDFNSDENFLEIEETLNNLIIENLIEDIFNKAFMNW